MKQQDKEKLDKLKNKFGKSFNSKIKVRRNFPFGKKSNAEIIIEIKAVKGGWKINGNTKQKE